MSANLMAIIERRYHGSIGACARDIGVDRASLWRWATGRTRNPTSELLRRVSQGLGVSTDHLLTGDSNATGRKGT